MAGDGMVRRGVVWCGVHHPRFSSAACFISYPSSPSCPPPAPPPFPQAFFSMGTLGRHLSQWDPPIDEQTGKPPLLPWMSAHWHGIMHNGFIHIK